MTELLIDTQKKALDTETKLLEELTTIRKWVTFFGVLSVISLIFGVIAGLTALTH